MTDVFLSYSSADRVVAERVQKALSARGLDVFWDQTIPTGQDWDNWIRSRLNDARVVVVLWSKSSVQSPNVRHEAMVARGAGKLLPVMVDALKPEDFPMGLYLVQALMIGDARDPDAPAMQRLSDEVHRQLEREPGPAAKGASRKKGAGLPILAAVLALALVGGGGAYVWNTMMRPVAGPEGAGPVDAGVQPAQAAPAVVAAPPVLSAPAADPCAQARADLDAVRDSSSRAILEAYLEATPDACALQETVVRERLAAISSAARDAEARKTREWNGVPGFDGDWVMESGACFELPWRFQPVDMRLRRTLSSGATDMWEVKSTNPPTLIWSDGSAMMLEGETIRYVDPDGKLNCVLKRR